MDATKYLIKVWRNNPKQYTPTVNEIVDNDGLASWLQILFNNTKSKSNEPMIQKVIINITQRKFQRGM